MEACVASARRAGVFKEFHVFTDRLIPECVSYDAMDFNAEAGLFKLLYLKAGMAKLNFDYFVWIDADTWFVRRPKNLLDALGNAPVHLPFELKLSEVQDSVEVQGFAPGEYSSIMRRAGILNDIYYGESAFWIVHHDAVDHLCDLATSFLNGCRRIGQPQSATMGLSYAAQLLCGNPERHLCLRRRDLWAPARGRHFKGKPPDGQPWLYMAPLIDREEIVNTAIVHLGNRGIQNVETARELVENLTA